MKTGILLLNVGTPEELTLPSVRKYLRAFLMDPYVIEAPKLLRWLLVQSVVLPVRAPRTLEKYRQIWTEKGSPLAFHSRDLENGLQRELGEQFVVKTGFRCGSYPIGQAIDSLRQAGCERLCLVPLFPQRAYSTTDNVVDAALAEARDFKQIATTPEFFAEDWFLEAWARVIDQSFALAGGMDSYDRLVLSYHGLPIPKATVYQPQCLATSEGIREKLGLSKDRVITSFQSRFGPLKWIGPATSMVLQDLARQGHARVAIACPSFVVDGLESLEEIGIGLKREFIEQGGQSLCLIPCLNAGAFWMQGLSQFLVKQLSQERDGENGTQKKTAALTAL